MNKKIKIALWSLAGIILAYIGVCFVVFYPSYQLYKNIQQGNIADFKELSLAVDKQLNYFDVKLILVKPILAIKPSWQKKADKLRLLAQNKAVVDALVGTDGEKTYLVLMQNNAEIRPSGGFWGAYGVMKIMNGKILSFQTGDTYLFDLASKGKFAPPENTNNFFENEWRLWNANWSPDFEQSAQNALFFYSQIDPETKFDGVIGPNVDYLLSILESTGPIKIPGYEFSIDKNNFVQKMIYEPIDPAVIASKKDDPNFITSNIAAKALLGEIAKDLLEKILSNHQEKNFALKSYWALSKKDLLLYFTGQSNQEKTSLLGWSGKLAGGNSVMVVDANIGSKLDFFVEKKAKISQIESGKYELTLSYRNNYRKDLDPNQYFTTYRDQVRVFIPSGSKIVEQTGGNSPLELTNDPGANKDIMTDLLIISPGENQSIKFVWQVPQNLYNEELKIDRQSGNYLKIIY